MSGPIVFISHNKLKQGKLDALRKVNQESFQLIKEQKPNTIVFLGYLGEGNRAVSFIHVFPDAQAMDLHFEGAQERAKRAYELIEPLSMEIYGSPSDGVLKMLKQIAASGVTVRIDPHHLGGFLRLNKS